MSHSPLDDQASRPRGRFAQALGAFERLLRAGELSWSGNERNCAFLNLGSDAVGARYACISAVSGFDFDDDGRAVAPVDWDRDGDLDLWLSNRTGPQVRLLRNDTADRAHHIAILVEGDGVVVNRDAIGARVWVDVRGEPVRMQSVRAGDGFLSQGSRWLCFGLGDATAIDGIRIRWPNGAEQRYPAVPVDRRYRARFGTDRLEPVATPAPTGSLRAQPLPRTTPRTRAEIPLFRPRIAPAIPIERATGESTTIAPRAGRWALVHLWSADCRVCDAERNALDRHRRALGASIDLHAVCVDRVDGPTTNRDPTRDPATNVAAPATAEPVAFATRTTIARLDALYAAAVRRHPRLPIPSSFLFDDRGRLAAIYRGPVAADALLRDVARLRDRGSDVDAFLPFSGRRYVDIPTADTAEVTRALLERGDTAGAEAVAARAGGKGATNQRRAIAAAHMQAGVDALRAGRDDDAATAFRAAVAADPSAVAPRYRLATIARRNNALAEAAREYEQIVAIAPREYGARYNLGLVYLRLDRANDAFAHLDAAARIRRSDPVPAVALGRALAAAGRLGDAVRAFTNAVERDANHLDARINLGTALARIGRLEDAARHLRAALAIDPANALAKKNLGVVERAMRDR